MSVINSWASRLFVAAENAFDAGPGSSGTQAVWAAGDALAHIDADFGGAQVARTAHRKDRTGTRSPSLGLVHGSKYPIEGTVRCSIAPSGTAGTEPDDGPLLLNAFGQKTVSGSSLYEILAEPTDTVALQLCDSDGRYAEYLLGAVVTNYEISFEAEEPEEIFTIGAARKASIAQDALSGQLAQAATSMTVANPELWVDPYGLVITIESEDILLSSTESDFNFTTGVFSGITRGHNSTSDVLHADATAISPKVTTTTTTGSPVGEEKVTASIGGTAIVVTSGGLSFATGRGHRPMERGSSRVQGVVPRLLEARMNLSGIMDTGTDSALPGKAVQNVEGATVITIGTAAGSIRTITATKSKPVSVTTPRSADDPVTFEAEFLAYGSSGNDDLKIEDT